jgi:hypothetical protein
MPRRLHGAIEAEAFRLLVAHTDTRHPLEVIVGDELLGDLGNPRTDLRIPGVGVARPDTSVPTAC